MSKISNQSQITSKFTLPDMSERENISKSNIVSTENMSVSFKKEKVSEKNFAVVGDEVLQTITLTNESEFEIKNIGVQEEISSGGEFKTGSVIINNVKSDTANIVDGFSLQSPLSPNETLTITYILIANESANQQITAVTKLNYVVDNLNFSENTQSISIDVLNEQITIIQSANKIAVITGETIIFENIITNEGTIENTDIVYQNILPQELEFVENSVQINDEIKQGLNPNSGFNLENLAPKASVNVKFNALVK